VNLSGIQVRDPGIQSVVQETLTKAGLAARRLELEITESVLLEENAENLQVINNLRQLGLLVSMDDFGKGYSSLNHLLKFPYGKIKLDLSLIRNIEDDDKAVAVVKAILALGEALRMTVTAEGVETEAQLSILKRIGCPQVQGYLLGYPIEVDEIPALLSAGR
jgi:EAL domain-containing protein (putative c-di-GMP-specific phosphodiesterase class I)